MTAINNTLIDTIINHARWAPSGDNMQTWRFEIITTSHFVVHGYDTSAHCVYDLRGHASQLAIGTLLENIAITASHLGYNADMQLRTHNADTYLTIDVTLTANVTIKPDPLFPYLSMRCVQRRPLKTKRLSAEQKAALQDAIGNGYRIHWLESWQQRWRTALLLFNNGKLRLTLPEAFATHSTVIEWNARFSTDKIPDQAIGLDALTMRLMHWALTSWARVNLLNRYFAGTLLPRIELDLLPGLFCAAHFALLAKEKPQTVQDYLNAGRAVQRFWLTATLLNLQCQPETTPLIFTRYIMENVAFTQDATLTAYAQTLSNQLSDLLGTSAIEHAVFLGRIGQGKTADARSLRLSVAQLLTPSS